MRAKRWLFLGPVAVTAAFFACTLNPQPLPPTDNMASNGAAEAGGGSFRGDGEAAEPVDNPPPKPVDGGTGAADGDGSSDAGDADASDASDDADAE